MPRPPPPPSASTSSSSSAVIVAIVVSSAVLASFSIYLLLRLFCRRRHRTFSAVDDVIVTAATSSPPENSLVSSLPAFKFGAGAGALTGGDCAVCLAKFERSDLLRLLPLCCHAFHAQCVDTWLISNLTCPLCRSTVTPTDDEVFDKILSQTELASNSFRIEIGSISRRSGGLSGGRRSYSVGDFDYIIDESYNYEVPIESMTRHRNGISDDSNKFAPSAPPEELAAAVGGGGGGRSWLREYVDRLSSVSSGRFFTGSSRRSETAVAAGVAVEDGEAMRVGEEISEIFRWLSGV